MKVEDLALLDDLHELASIAGLGQCIYILSIPVPVLMSAFISIAGSLEFKLRTIWIDGKAEVGREQQKREDRRKK